MAELVCIDVFAANGCVRHTVRSYPMGELARRLRRDESQGLIWRLGADRLIVTSPLLRARAQWHIWLAFEREKVLTDR